VSEEVSTDEFRLDFEPLVLGIEVRASYERDDCIPAEIVLVVIETAREVATLTDVSQRWGIIPNTIETDVGRRGVKSVA
jgi:hypothetical protein